MRLFNSYLSQTQKVDLPESFLWIRKLPEIDLPPHTGYTLIALLLLALASTVYKVGCPQEIQKSSEARWRQEIGQSILVYQSMSGSRLFARWSSAICYLTGGSWLAYLLLQRLWDALTYIFAKSVSRFGFQLLELAL